MESGEVKYTEKRALQSLPVRFHDVVQGYRAQRTYDFPHLDAAVLASLVDGTLEIWTKDGGEWTSFTMEPSQMRVLRDILTHWLEERYKEATQ